MVELEFLVLQLGARAVASPSDPHVSVWSSSKLATKRDFLEMEASLYND